MGSLPGKALGCLGAAFRESSREFQGVPLLGIPPGLFLGLVPGSLGAKIALPVPGALESHGAPEFVRRVCLVPRRQKSHQ